MSLTRTRPQPGGATEAEAPDRTPDNLHLDPPFTPATLFGPPGRVAGLLAVVVALLAAGAAHNDGQVLLAVDEPIRDLVEDHRTAWATRALTAVTMLGHQNVILPATLVLVILTWRRCRMATFLLLAGTVGRIVVHLGFKDTTVRPRPDGEALISAVGNSFPSGHVISAVLVWGLVPFVVGLYSTRRLLWYGAVAAAAIVMVANTFSRFYLGVHWFTDSIAGLLIGWMFLIGFATGIRRHHEGLPLLPGRMGEALARRAGPDRPSVSIQS